MLPNVKKYVSAWICINILSEGKVSLIYKKYEKSEKKFLDEVTTRWIYANLGGVVVCFEKIGQNKLVYIV